MEHIDKNIQSKIKGHRSEFDGEDFWSQLEPQLPVKKRRRILPFWWTFGALAVIFFFIIMNISSETSECNHLPIPKIENPNFSNHPILNVNTPSIRDAHSTMTDDDSASGTSLPESKSTSNKSVKSMETGNPHFKKESPTKKYKIDEPIFTQINDNTVQKPSIKNVDNQNTPNAYTPTKTQDHPIASVDKSWVSPFLPQQTILLDLENVEASTLKELKSHQASSWKKHLSVHGGAFYSQPHFHNTNNNDANLAVIRDQTETAWTAYNLGLNMKWINRSHWGISSGLEYVQQNSLFQSQASSSEVSATTFQKRLSTPQGDTLVNVPDYVTTTSNRSTQNMNSINFISFPVQFHYVTSLYSLPIELHAGVTFNHILSSSGKSLTAQGEIISWEDSPEHDLNRSIFLSYRLGATISKPLSRQTYLTFSPSLRWSKGNLLKGDASVQQGFSQVGAQLGIAKRW